MTEQDRIATVEREMRAACTEARRVGLVLVRDDLVVRSGHSVYGKPIACCAWGAVGLTGADVRLEDFEIDAPEYDAIEHGWDGTREHAERDGLPMPWFDLGARLAAEFLPVAATTLEAG